MVEWVLLPVEFKGIWFNSSYGGFSVYLKDRFNPDYPPDRLREAILKRGLKSIIDETHKFASPKWMSKKEFEDKFGKVKKILVNKETWKSNNFDTPKEDDLLIITEDYIVVMDEYDGKEYFKTIEKNILTLAII